MTGCVLCPDTPLLFVCARLCVCAWATMTMKHSVATVQGQAKLRIGIPVVAPRASETVRGCTAVLGSLALRFASRVIRNYL